MARLKKAQRDKLPASDFAGPNRSYPVEDKKHARAAIMLAGHDPAHEASIKARARAVLKGGK